MIAFDVIRERARRRARAALAALAALLPAVPPASALAELTDDRVLAAVAKRVFSAGFVWSVIEAKWPGFEAAFLHFDPAALMFQADDFWDALESDSRIVRNGAKIRSVRDNAGFVRRIAVEHVNFGRFLAGWPADDEVGLLDVLASSGSRLGSTTGQMLLRFLGFDGFVTSQDVVRCLREAGVDVAPEPKSKRDLAKIQEAFNAWRAETGLPYTHRRASAPCRSARIARRRTMSMAGPGRPGPSVQARPLDRGSVPSRRLTRRRFGIALERFGEERDAVAQALVGDRSLLDLALGRHRQWPAGRDRAWSIFCAGLIGHSVSARSMELSVGMLAHLQQHLGLLLQLRSSALQESSQKLLLQGDDGNRYRMRPVFDAVGIRAISASTPRARSLRNCRADVGPGRPSWQSRSSGALTLVQSGMRELPKFSSVASLLPKAVLVKSRRLAPELFLR